MYGMSRKFRDCQMQSTIIEDKATSRKTHLETFRIYLVYKLYT